MAARRLVPVLLAGLLLLLLLAPAAAAAGGHGSGARAAAGSTSESGRAGAGDTGPAAHASVGGAAQHAEASSITVDTGLADGRAYRGVTRVRAAAGTGGATTQAPRPEVSHSPARPYAVQSETAGSRVARAGGDGGGRDRGQGAAAPHDGGPHRGPPPTPAPEAVPTRTGHEPGDSGRGRKDGTHLPLPTTGETETPDPLLLLRFLLVLGFRRVRPGNVLEHPVRRGLHAAIGAEPGLDLAGCAAATGANRETLRYHLALLVCCGKVVEETRSGSVRYFPHDQALTPVHRALLHARRNESLAPLLAAVRDAPGISRGELADRLGVAGPSVTRQVQRLIEDGLVESERCGRSTCYRLTPDCASALGPALPAGDRLRPGS